MVIKDNCCCFLRSDCITPETKKLLAGFKTGLPSPERPLSQHIYIRVIIYWTNTYTLESLKCRVVCVNYPFVVHVRIKSPICLFISKYTHRPFKYWLGISIREWQPSSQTASMSENGGGFNSVRIWNQQCPLRYHRQCHRTMCSLQKSQRYVLILQNTCIVF